MNFYKGGPYDPQLLNRYSYARNNPLKYNDSSGHWIWAVVGGLVGAAVGLGAYAITNHDNFKWGEAAVWAGGGALIGATCGAAAEVVIPTITGAATATAPSLPFAYRAIQWIQAGNTGKIVHIMQTRHCWNLIAKSFDEVQAIIQRVIQSVDMVATGEYTSLGAPIFQYTSEVQGYNVLVQAYYDVQTAAWVIVDGWVIVP
jgi:hypothetical protein